MKIFNRRSELVFRGFPKITQEAIQANQEILDAEVRKQGEFRKTSSFRCASYQYTLYGCEKVKKNPSVLDSHHLYGSAADYGKEKRIRETEKIGVIEEGDHYHVYLK